MSAHAFAKTLGMSFLWEGQHYWERYFHISKHWRFYKQARLWKSTLSLIILAYLYHSVKTYKTHPVTASILTIIPGIGAIIYGLQMPSLWRI
jgi:hypothetical protein